MRAADEAAAAIEAVLVGQVERRLDDAAAAADRVSGRIFQSLMSQLGEVYRLGTSIGLAIPTTEQVRYGLSTGDYSGEQEAESAEGAGPVSGGPAEADSPDSNDRDDAGGYRGPPVPAGPVIPGGPIGPLPPGPTNPGSQSACLNPDMLPWNNVPQETYTPGQYHDPWLANQHPAPCWGWESTAVYTCAPNGGGGYGMVQIGHPPGGFLGLLPSGQLTWNLDTPVGWPAPTVPGTSRPMPPGQACDTPGGGGVIGSGPGVGGGPHTPGTCCVNLDRAGIVRTYPEALATAHGSPRRMRPWTLGNSGEPPGAYQSMGFYDCPRASLDPHNSYCRWPAGSEVRVFADGLWVVTDGSGDPFPQDCILLTGSSVVQGDVNPPGGWGPPPGPTGPAPEYCVPPQGASCPPPITGGAVGAGDVHKCEDFTAFIQRVATSGIDPVSWLGMGANDTGQLTGWMGGFAQLFSGGAGPIVPGLLNRFSKQLTDWISTAVKVGDCDVARLTPLALMKGVLGFLERWTGAMPAPLMTTLDQALNTLCQSVLPSASEADAARLADVITKESWECWVKAAGHHVEPAEQMFDAKRTRPDPAQLAVLHRRKQLTDAEYDRMIRATGVTKEEDKKAIYALTQSWPGISDVVLFLTRDVADPNIVKTFGLDDEFEEKWQGDLIKYADAVGVPKELAQYFWRAHWHLPSPTQLYEMLHRLRPGRVPKEVEVTQDMVRTCLKQNDLLPFWVDREIAISYRPINRTDALNAYSVYAFNDDDMLGLFQDEGYSPEDAAKMMKLVNAKRTQQERRQSGLPSIKQLTTQFAAGLLAEEELQQILTELGYTPERIEVTLSAAKLSQRVAIRRTTIAFVKQRYVNGILGEGDATAELAEGGVPIEGVNQLMEVWGRMRNSRGKMAGAKQLCKWRGLNLITSGEQELALARLGWREQDRARITAECTSDLTEEAIKRQEREIARAERAQKRLAKLEEERKKREAAQAAYGFTLPTVPLSGGEGDQNGSSQA